MTLRTTTFLTRHEGCQKMEIGESVFLPLTTLQYGTPYYGNKICHQRDTFTDFHNFFSFLQISKTKIDEYSGFFSSKIEKWRENWLVKLRKWIICHIYVHYMIVYHQTNKLYFKVNWGRFKKKGIKSGLVSTQEGRGSHHRLKKSTFYTISILNFSLFVHHPFVVHDIFYIDFKR